MADVIQAWASLNLVALALRVMWVEIRQLRQKAGQR